MTCFEEGGDVDVQCWDCTVHEWCPVAQLKQASQGHTVLASIF